MSTSGMLLALMVTVVTVVVSQCVAGLPATTVLQVNDVNYRDHLKVQYEELKSLSCVPKPGKVTVRNELLDHDSLLAETFYPEVIAVSRCWENCTTFCGTLHKGKPEGRCLPDPKGIVKRPYYVSYFKDNEKVHREVMLTEHTSCKCS